MAWLTPLALALHVIFVAVWVGGMFFAYVVLRPVAGRTLETPQRLTLWRGVLGKFFVWVWHAVVIVPLTGYYLAYSVFGGMAGWPTYVHLMHGLGLVMVLVYLYVFFVPFKALRREVAAHVWPAAGSALAGIRQMVGLNLLLGLLVVAIATAGRMGGF